MTMPFIGCVVKRIAISDERCSSVRPSGLIGPIIANPRPMPSPARVMPRPPSAKTEARRDMSPYEYTTSYLSDHDEIVQGLNTALNAALAAEAADPLTYMAGILLAEAEKMQAKQAPPVDVSSPVGVRATTNELVGAGVESKQAAVMDVADAPAPTMPNVAPPAPAEPVADPTPEPVAEPVAAVPESVAAEPAVIAEPAPEPVTAAPIVPPAAVASAVPTVVITTTESDVVTLKFRFD